MEEKSGLTASNKLSGSYAAICGNGIGALLMLCCYNKTFEAGHFIMKE